MTPFTATVLAFVQGQVRAYPVVLGASAYRTFRETVFRLYSDYMDTDIDPWPIFEQLEYQIGDWILEHPAFAIFDDRQIYGIMYTRTVHGDYRAELRQHHTHSTTEWEWAIDRQIHQLEYAGEFVRSAFISLVG
jgi:hypothetical protein